MALPSCSLSILVARTDIPFMMHTIPHLVRTCNFPFTERVLAVDTAPLTGDKVNRPGVGTMEELRACCNELLKKGVIDKIVDINYDKTYQHRVYTKHFDSRIRQTHNYKGYPILGTIFTIEESQSDYMLHFDSDMLLYQQSGHSWIEEGIKLLQEKPDIMAVRPLTGPPTQDGSMQQIFPYELDSNGFYRFKFFGSRAYLIDRKRFDRLLPLKVLWRPAKTKIINLLPSKIQTLVNYFANKGALDSWEVMISKQLENTSYFRATLSSPKAWTLHPIKRGPEFIEALPNIIEKIESGWYPSEQAGHYDLKFELWL
ncbi:hypothetical protein [Calothrix sp. PCC 7507]|uniref:hypothetical protein n=1 Tax=Calothrix sp. PCC 7507 TaxID=99598 RepID=UPI00029F4B08|nr:hypothetical protein [Calothrix sp. PCC 7507]AFY34105.1 hypothetical protein Cal7507_3714 [Calothrix sp. PCC 7507]